MRTGDRCDRTDVYLSECRCRVRIRMTRDLPFPECDICNSATTWEREVPPPAQSKRPPPKPVKK
jgi:hypothetical protein